MVQSSVTVQFLLAFWSALTGLWEDSRVNRGLRALGRGLTGALRGSVLCRFVWRDGVLPKSWPESVTCRWVTGLIDLPGAICQAVYRAGKRVWDGSVCFRGLSALGGACSGLLGLFLAVMLVAPHELWDNRYGLLGAIALTALFVLGSAARPRQRLQPDAFGPYYILFLAAVCYAFLGSLSWGLSARFLGFHLAAFLLALLAVSTVEKYEHLELLAVLVAGAITIAALFACYQWATGVAWNDPMYGTEKWKRVYSFFDNPNNFAELLVMLAPLNYALFLNAKRWWGKAAALCSLAVCAAALGLSLSRSGFLGFGLATLVFILFWNWKLIPLLAVLALCCVPFLPQSIYDRILSIGDRGDTSVSYRMSIYQASWVLMKDHWLRGVGLGSDVLQRVFETYPPMPDGKVPIHTHNNYLQMWAETGLFGAAAFAGSLLYQLKTGAKAVLGCRDRRLKNLLAAALAGFCGILLISVAEYTWFYARNMFLYFFLFGFIAAGVKLARRQA